MYFASSQYCFALKFEIKFLCIVKINIRCNLHVGNQMVVFLLMDQH
jgi:hypothetical protein